MALSLLPTYDNLIRETLVLTESAVEPEFLRFALGQEEARQKWLASELQAQKLQNELQKLKHDNLALEGKLHHARVLLDEEKKRRFNVENELIGIEQQMELVREVVMQGKCQFYDDTKEKLAFLNTTCKSRHGSTPGAGGGRRSLNNRLNTISEDLDSTGSLLSNLSYSHSEDDLDASIGRKKTWKKAHKSPVRDTPAKRQRRSISKTFGVDGVDKDRVVATTTLTVNRNGPITATSQIESVPDQKVPSVDLNFAPSAPLITGTPSSSELSLDCIPPSNNHADLVIGPLQECSPNIGVFALGMTNNMINRHHDFCPKTILKPELCGPCGKRMKFGKGAMRCRDCRAVVHPECKEQVPLPCIPVGCTPTSKGTVGTLADYAPVQPPMVPSLIVHCIKEVERRGLNELGIYRTSSTQKDVKNLKEKFLRGRGTPNLSSVDIHTICCTIKDFLRSLREPPVTYVLWPDFVKAADIGDPEDARTAMYQAITELPQPNRDTIAYLMLHLQRVADSPDCRMSISNLAKVFGPCVVGYSRDEPAPDQVIPETKKQAAVMEQLLNIPSEYWLSFIAGNSSEPVNPRDNIHRTPSNNFFSTRSSAGVIHDFFNSNGGSYSTYKPRTPHGKYFDPSSPLASHH